MNEQQITQQLQRYVPPHTAPILAKWIMDYSISIRISPPRNSKLGDYRPPHNGHGHRISVNGSLNPYSFLITFIHEVAHLITWERHQHNVQPHGYEWKRNFQKLMKPFLTDQVFPTDILHALLLYMRNPAASSCRDSRLQKVLSSYNPDHEQRDWHYLEDLPTGTLFIIENGRAFQKLDKLRKNFKCMELDSKKMFRISPIMKVKVLE